MFWNFYYTWTRRIHNLKTISFHRGMEESDEGEVFAIQAYGDVAWPWF